MFGKIAAAGGDLGDAASAWEHVEELIP